MEAELIPIQDLFGGIRTMKRDGKVLSERADLIRFFQEEKFVDKNGKVFQAQFIAIRLGHFTTDQLYALKSGYLDRKKRDGELRAKKYFWALTKTQVIHS